MITFLVSALVILMRGIFAFPVAFIFGLAWQAIAYEFNLPEFGYWQMFFISWALLILKPSPATTNDKD